MGIMIRGCIDGCDHNWLYGNYMFYSIFDILVVFVAEMALGLGHTSPVPSSSYPAQADLC